MSQHFRMFAAYNTWANDRVYNAASDLTDEEYQRDCGAFFKSMHGTLNHVLVADRIWLSRFTGEGEAPDQLDAILFENFQHLRNARMAEDRRIIEWIDRLDEETLEGLFHYTPITDPRPISQRLAPAIAHFFNHQTHHRGHAHMILSILGKEAPSLDMIYFLRTDGGKSFT